MNVFLSFSFRPEDAELVALVERLLASHNARPINGKILGGQALTPAVMEKIRNCDALISLLTRREELQGGRWRTHPWVRDELNHARALSMPAIALIEDGVDSGGAFNENEHIPLDRNDPLSAILRLSETIGSWKAELGRNLKVRLGPDEVAVPLARNGNGGGWRCRYRLGEMGEFSEWQDATAVREVGGVFLYLRGVADRQLVAVEVMGNGRIWSAPAQPQWMDVELEEG